MREIEASKEDQSTVEAKEDWSVAGSTGNDCKVEAQGYCSIAGSTGNESTVKSQKGFSLAGNTGNECIVEAQDKFSVGVGIGRYNKVSVSGIDSVAVNIGVMGIAKGVMGCMLVLKDWKTDKINGVIVDGKKIKADTYYKLENGRFIKIKEG